MKIENTSLSTATGVVTPMQGCNCLIQAADTMVEPLSEVLHEHYFVLTATGSIYEFNTKLLYFCHPTAQVHNLMAKNYTCGKLMSLISTWQAVAKAWI